MRNVLFRACLLGGMAMGVGLVRAAPAGKAAPPESGPVKVKLTPAPLPAPDFTLTGGGPRGAAVLNGIILPDTAATFGSGEAPVSASIAGVPVTFMRSGLMFGMQAGGNPMPLQRVGAGFRSVPIKGKNGPYLVGFPYGQTLPQSATLYYCSGFVMKGTLNGSTILIYDNDMDGSFTMSDSARVVAGGTGSACALAPLSKHLATPTGLYRINSIAENGLEMECERVAEETAKLAFAFNSAEGELHAVFGSKKADLNFVAVANPRVGSELVVAPGSYDLQYGMVYAPRLNKIVASVTKGKLGAAEAATSTEKPSKFALGGPFNLTFTHRMSGDKLTVNPATFKVTGQGGEEYHGVKFASAEIGLVSGGKAVSIGKMAFG